MIFTGFKRKSVQLFFKKHLAEFLGNSRENNEGKVKNVLVFMDNISVKSEIINDLKSILNISENDIEILLFQKKIKKNKEDKNVFSPKDFGWDGKIKSERLSNILTNKYDLLINYSKVENIYSNLLILQSKTALNVGFSHLDKRFYDLIIRCDRSDIALFNKELKKYLAILKKI
jgi:hypothetical protein